MQKKICLFLVICQLLSTPYYQTQVLAATSNNGHDAIATTMITSYTVTYMVDGVAMFSDTLASGSLLTFYTPEIKTGHTFAGWYTAETSGQRWDFTADTMPTSNITLYARYTVNWYSVFYIDDGGRYQTVIPARYNVLLANLVGPIRMDAVFLGWYTEEVGGEQWDFTTARMPANDVTLYARYLENEYTLIYDDGDQTQTLTVSEHALLAEPTPPVKTGFTFIGWYTDLTDGVVWDFTTDRMPARNLTLYARYTTNEYHVTYFDETTMLQQSSANYQTLLTAPSSPEKSGSTFIGWYTAETGGRLWDFQTDKMPATDLSLYARYAINQYDVSYINEGTLVQQLTVNYQALLTAPTSPTKHGYTFVGWYISETADEAWDFTTDRMPAADITLYAKYTVNQYNVTYMQETEILHQTAVDYQDLVPEYTAEVRTGYTFAGWYTDSEAGAAWDFQNNTMPAANLTLYARYTANQYSVTYLDNTTTYHQETVQYQNFLTEPAVLEKIGQTFIGWYTAIDGGSQWDFSVDKMPATNIMLYARYTRNSYTVTYHDNGEIMVETVLYDTHLTDKKAIGEAGYKFTGWYTSATNGVKWDFATDKMPANNVTLYAYYTAEEQRITFDINGGDANTKPLDIVAPTASQININDVTTPTRNGYTFIGWYHGETQIFGVINMPAGGLTLVAKWEQIPIALELDAQNVEMTMPEINEHIEKGTIHQEIVVRSNAKIRSTAENGRSRRIYAELKNLIE